MVAFRHALLKVLYDGVAAGAVSWYPKSGLPQLGSAMELIIGLVVGGDSPANEGTVDRIHQLIQATIDSDGESDGRFFLRFFVNGPVYEPEFQGVRVERLQRKTKSVTVDVAVPESFVSESERDAFLRDALRLSLDQAEKALTERDLRWSLTAVRELANRVLADVLGEPTNGRTEQPRVAPSAEAPRDGRAGGMVKLYRAGVGGQRYWEAWPDGSLVVVHTGTVGDRGEVTRLSVRPGDAVESVIREAMQEPLRQGFRPVDELEVGEFVLQYPAGVFDTPEKVDEAWRKVGHLLNEEMGWLGLGRVVNIDYSGELTFQIQTVDEEKAIDAARRCLQREGCLEGAMVGVETSDGYVALWPEDRKGTRLSW